MSKHISILSILVISLAFVACKKECHEKEDEYYYILEDEKDVLKYTGNETIKYLHNKSDTVIFKGLGKSTYFNVSNSYDQCPVKYYYDEGWLFSYIDNKDSNKIYVNQQVRVITSDVSFSFKKHQFGYSYGTGEIEYGIDTLFCLNKIYTNISKPIPYTDYGDTLFYDKLKGIVKVVTKNDTWELIE